MTLIKLCGLRRTEDIRIANALRPEYVGFILVPQSRRCVTAVKLRQLRQFLSSDIKAVGVFADAALATVADYLENGFIDMVQLHGHEDELYVNRLRQLTDKPIIKAFSINSKEDIYRAEQCSSDYILLDASGGGTGKSFDWSLLEMCRRPYFLAGGLQPDNVGKAITLYHPYGVDVSSGIEVNGSKNKNKAELFVKNVRNT